MLISALVNLNSLLQKLRSHGGLDPSATHGRLQISSVRSGLKVRAELGRLEHLGDIQGLWLYAVSSSRKAYWNYVRPSHPNRGGAWKAHRIGGILYWNRARSRLDILSQPTVLLEGWMRGGWLKLLASEQSVEKII